MENRFFEGFEKVSISLGSMWKSYRSHAALKPAKAIAAKSKETKERLFGVAGRLRGAAEALHSRGAGQYARSAGHKGEQAYVAGVQASKQGSKDYWKSVRRSTGVVAAPFAAAGAVGAYGYSRARDKSKQTYEMPQPQRY